MTDLLLSAEKRKASLMLQLCINDPSHIALVTNMLSFISFTSLYNACYVTT